MCVMGEGGGLDKKDYTYKEQRSGGCYRLSHVCDSLLATPSGEHTKKTSSCAKY